ncbi:MAG: CBS domain-containing protein, partial [Kangiellaceae bacterium]|nr:CBS domain-containing protein [Kangiellaceae bacterium]
VTDRAFCTKIVADNLSHESPVGLIMSENLLTIDEQTSAAEAMLIMARHNVRHLPVVNGEDVRGVLTATDLIHRQSNNPIYLINQIHKTNSVYKIAEHAKQLAPTLTGMVSNGYNAREIAYTISSIGRAINVQLIKLSELKYGPPPVKYAWIIAGSLARNDQTAHSDQDNGLILSDDYQENLHEDYFINLSRFVCDGLNQCGYIYCPGEVMSTTKKWRQPLSQWKDYFRQWMLTPKPKALMYASIFFDLRCIYGESSFLTELNDLVKELVNENHMFLNYMAANALQNSPPLGIFRNFVLEKYGSEEKTLDLKKRGVVPITDLARVYALSAGITDINTQERLKACCVVGELSKSGYMDLIDAFEFLSMVRIKHQAKQINHSVEPNNYLPPDELSSLEKRHLKDTFEVIRTYQNALELSYQAGMLR